jgi:integrase
MGYSMLFRRGAVWTFRKVIPRECRAILGRSAFVVSLRTTDWETAKKLLPAEAIKATRAIEGAKLTLQRGPEATVERVSARMRADYRKVYPFGVQREVDADTAEDAFSQVTEADVLVDELYRLDDKLTSSRNLDPRTVIEIRAKMAAIKALLNGDAKDHGPLLSAVLDMWRTERRPANKTWLEFRRALDGFTEVCGDLPVQAIKRDHVRAFKTALLESKSRRGKKERAETIKVATAQKLLATLRSVLEYATREGLIDSNPAHGVYRIAAIQPKAAVEDRRLPFTLEQVRTIFEKLPTARDIRIQRIVRLAFWTGGRLAELCGLRPGDLREEEGVWYFAIEPHSGRGLKNRSSIRRVPLHPAIQDFTPDMLKPVSSHYMGRKVNGWLRKVAGITDPRLTLHSARHSFKDRCRAAGLTEEVHDALTGHSNGSVSRSYGRGVPLTVLAKEITKIQY